MQPFCKSGIADTGLVLDDKKDLPFFRILYIPKYLFLFRINSPVFKEVYPVAISFPDNFSFPEQEKEMVPGRPAVDVCIEGNICDSTARVAADIVEDGTPVFIVQQLFDPAKDQRAEFDRPKTASTIPMTQSAWTQSGSRKKDMLASAPEAS